MKFRQFEFRLFPRIRSRRKKKTKINHTDYPRDISLDKNCNFYKSGFPCFYDNLAADATIREQFPGYILCSSQGPDIDTSGVFSEEYSKANTFPLRELQIDINSSCSCDHCAGATDNLTSANTAFPEICTGSATGTSHTIPKARTRIKTNPWLPSPRTTPSSSPTDHYQQLTGFPTENDGCDLTLYVTRPSTLPLFPPRSSSYSSVSHLSAPLNGLTEIPEHDTVTRKLYDNKGEYLYSTINKEKVADMVDDLGQSPVNSFLKDNLNYETDISNCSTPLTEFLKCVKYEIDFSYEQTADDLLESSTFPRDDSFNSSINTFVDIPEKEEIEGIDKQSIEMKIDDDAELTFDDSNNNMQESIDTGYCSVSRDSDFMSSDDEFGMKSEIRNEIEDTEDIDSETDNNELPNKKEQVGLTENDGICTNDIHNMRDFDLESEHSHANELEWDDEPLTQTLLLEFPLDIISAQNGSTLDDRHMNQNDDSFRSPVKRFNSVKYRRNNADQFSEKECTCYRRRSRSLADIALSLDEKVVLLREEKTFVQRKIREAILEERIREHQMKVFRLLSGDKKKQLIVKTLNDLKTRLDDQSARLQASYSTVISMQKLYSKKQRGQES